ncbi:MAG: lipoprotein [Candidatus Nomurabacteria bacterium]|nr:lipoprotein [Candidatus Nomurabacteria bacterium]
MEQNYAKPLGRIDRWIKYIVHHAWIKTAVFIVALLEATISPLLPEIIVAAVLTYRKDVSWKVLSLISALGSATGVAILYLVGKFLYNLYKSFFDSWLGGATISHYTDIILHQNTFISMFLAAFTPLPDRIFAFLSGLLSLNFIVVIIAFFLGRLIRVGIVAYFSYKFGDEARVYILKHTKRAILILGGLILLYIAYKYFL